MSVIGQDLGSLRAGLSATAAVCVPGDEGYDEAVRIWNASVDRRPSIVVRCASDGDVVAALVFAQRESLEVSVRGGGHNYAGFALTDGGLMIDLTPMKTVTVDADARTAKCGGGTTWGELDAATQGHGLAVTGGFVSTTGVAGLTLGGGIGWLVRAAGLSCDNLVAARVVTADGRVLTADAEVNPDLFWAIRGGGGNFGVVTEFEFALHAVGPMVQFALFLFSPDQGGDLFRFARDYVRDLPADCGVLLAGLSAPSAPFVPAELHFQPAYGLLVVGLGDEASHARLIAPISQALEPMVQMVTPIPYAGLQQMFDESAPWGMHSYEKAVYLDELTDGAIEVILEHQGKKMSPLSFVPIFVLGGRYGATDPDSSAFGGGRGIGYVVNISATTPSPDDLPAEREWVRNYWSALVPHAVGVGSYVNFMTDPDPERIRNTYGDKYTRLQQVKATYDPNNVFHLNANIQPAVST
ncbi:FAD-binding oxidoreductase [Kribbella sp. NPDC026596]|uniref:FAD-binding oxidoreductase n=1 Tax=Kribbella sp. NPDC026596 TaxID=3155122 RepID=UPI0033C45173